jgi:crotonobetainyl-CoA:carnitine CoA-transferase CaiB-like acyl-CoA transferase
MLMPTAFEEVMAARGKGMPADGEVTITGKDPVYSTKFKIGETVTAVLAGVGTAVNDLHELKTGRRQNVAIDIRHGAATLRSGDYALQQGPSGNYEPLVSASHRAMVGMTQPFPTKDGRWVLPHFGLPHLQARMQKLLGCEATPESVAKAVAKWDALDLEAAIDEHRVCGGMVRTNAEWLAEEHGKVLAAKPIVEVIKLADSAPEPMPAGERPLDGIRALDLTRILAGPTCARTLAEHGADVLMVTAEGLPQIPHALIDTNHGKRSTYIDLKNPHDNAKLKELVRNADVFSQGYRPGMIEGLGFSPEDLAEVRPGIIYTSISCYGADGPFSHRAGWEQVAQTMTGICHEGTPDGPQLLPAAANDYTTGYLAAYGILLALARRATEGGSYHVRVSLCQSGMFIYRQGDVGYQKSGMDLSEAELNELLVESVPASGKLRHLGPVLRMSETPPLWDKPTPVLGGDKPEWLDAGCTRARAKE